MTWLLGGGGSPRGGKRLGVFHTLWLIFSFIAYDVVVCFRIRMLALMMVRRGMSARVVNSQQSGPFSGRRTWVRRLVDVSGIWDGPNSRGGMPIEQRGKYVTIGHAAGDDSGHRQVFATLQDGKLPVVLDKDAGEELLEVREQQGPSCKGLCVL